MLPARCHGLPGRLHVANTGTAAQERESRGLYQSEGRPHCNPNTPEASSARSSITARRCCANQNARFKDQFSEPSVVCIPIIQESSDPGPLVPVCSCL